MVVNLGENIIPTLQLVKSDGTSLETTATISYKIIDATGTVEVVSSQTAAYNSNTGSYTDTLIPSASWTTQEVGSYLISWSIADTDDDFPTIMTEPLEISLDVTKVDRILGLVHENIYIDNTNFDVLSNLVSARLRIYSNAVDVGTSNNVLSTYTISAAPTGAGKFLNWRQVRA